MRGYLIGIVIVGIFFLMASIFDLENGYILLWKVELFIGVLLCVIGLICLNLELYSTAQNNINLNKNKDLHEKLTAQNE